MSKQRPFATEEVPFSARKVDIGLPDGVEIPQQKFDPYNQTKEFNPLTQKQDILKTFDPYSMIQENKVNPTKMPFEILKNRIAADELAGRLPLGAGDQAQKDHQYLQSLSEKANRKLNEMNAVQSLAPYLSNKPTTAPTAYHQRYEWTLQALRKMGVKDKASYLQAKEKLQDAGGTEWYNLQQLISPLLKDDKGNPVALQEEDLYGRLAQEQVYDAMARPHALKMLYERGWKPYQEQKAQANKVQDAQAQGIEQGKVAKEPESHDFIQKNNNILQSFQEWKQKNDIQTDVTPLPMRTPDSPTATISKSAIEKEKAWLEGALLEHRLNKHIQEKSSDPFGRRYKMQEQLKHLPKGEQNFVAKLGDFATAVAGGYDGVSDRMAAIGEFLASPWEPMKSQDKEGEHLEQLIGQKNDILSSIQAAERAKDLKNRPVPFSDKNVYDFMGTEAPTLPLHPSPDNPDHYVVDKKALNERNLAETTLDALTDLAGYAYKKKFTALGIAAGAALAGLPTLGIGAGAGAVAGSAIGAGIDALLDDGTTPTGVNVNETALRTGLNQDVKGLRQNKQTNDIWGVEDPAETLLSSGIKSTGELLVDLEAVGGAVKGVQEGLSKGVPKLLSATKTVANKSPQLSQLFLKGIEVGEKASKFAGKPLAAVAQSSPKAMEAFNKIAPVFSKTFAGSGEAALDGAIHFGIAEMLRSNPNGTTPEKIGNAVADGAVFALAETAVKNVLMEGANKASQFVAKKKLDGYGKSTIDKGIYEGIENAAKLKEIETIGLETLAQQMKSADAIKKTAHVIAGGVAEPVQTLAENLRKEGNPLADYNATAFIGDIVGGLLFGGLGLPRVRQPKVDALGRPIVDRSGNTVMETVPFKSVADVKKAMDAMAVQEYTKQTSEAIQKGVQAQLQPLETLITKPNETPTENTQRVQAPPQEATQEGATRQGTPQQEEVAPSSPAKPTLSSTQQTLSHLINQFEGKPSETTQFSSKSVEADAGSNNTASMGASVSIGSSNTGLFTGADIVNEVKQTKATIDAYSDPISQKSNPVDNVPKVSQTVPQTTVDSVINDAVSIIANQLQEARSMGEVVDNTTIKNYADEVAGTIAFLQSKGANLAVFPSITVDGDTKYGAFTQRKDSDGSVLASVLALNLNDTLAAPSQSLKDRTLLGQKSFHEFNHRLRQAIDSGSIADYSAVSQPELASLKEQETLALNNLVSSSPYIKNLYDRHIASGLNEQQALEELSSIMFERIYAKNGNATDLMRHIAALDKQQVSQPDVVTDDTSFAKLVGRLPNSFKSAIEPLQNYFQGAKAANQLPPDIVQQAQVFQEYYDAALQTVTKREQGDAQQQLEQDVAQRFDPMAEAIKQQTEEFPNKPITQEQIDAHETLTDYASRELSDLQEDLDYALDLENMADMRKIPTFLKEYYNLKTVQEVYQAFLSPTGKFYHPDSFISSFLQHRAEQMEKAGLPMTQEEKDTAERFATKVWVKFQGYEPSQQSNVVITIDGDNTNHTAAVRVDNQPTRIGGANPKSTINKPAGGYRLKRANYQNFLDKLDYIAQSLADNGLESPLEGSPLVNALFEAAKYEISSLTLETPAQYKLEEGKLAPSDTPANNIDTGTGRYNQLEEAKWDPSIYQALPTIATDLLNQGWFLWNHADKGGAALLDMRDYMRDPQKVKQGIEGMNKMFINYFISNYDKPYTYSKVKTFIGGRELNPLNFINYKGKPNSNEVQVILDKKAISEYGLDEADVKKLIEELNKVPEPVTDKEGKVVESKKQSFMQELEEYVNKEVLQGYAFLPDTKEDITQDYLIGKTQSIIDSLMHIHIDPAFDRIKTIDKADPTTGQLKIAKANEKYMRGVIGANSYPLTREQFLMLPQAQSVYYHDKINMYGLEDDGQNIVARGYVLNTKRADKILAAFPNLAKVLTDATIDGGVLNVNEETQDFITLLGGQEGKSNKTHSHQRLENGALNFKQAIHRFDNLNSNNFASYFADAEGVSPVYQELKQFMNLMKAANIQYIIPDSALKSRAKYIGTKNVKTTDLYGKKMVMDAKGAIAGEYVNGEIKPPEEFKQTDGYAIITPDKEPFDSPMHPFVMALNAGHGLVKIPLTGNEGLQWMDSISPSTKKPESGGLPAQLLYKGHPLIDPNGLHGLNPNPALEQKLTEAGYGNNDAFTIITDRIQRHGALKRDRLWNGYTQMLSALEGNEPMNLPDIAFTLEEMLKGMKEKIQDLSNASVEQDILDYQLLKKALITDGETGEKTVNISALGPLFLMSDSLFENSNGKLTTITGYEKAGEDTKFFSMLAKEHERVASIKGRGALLTLVPDVARAQLDIARAKHLLTQSLNGTPLEVDGEPFEVDVADYLKLPDGTLDQAALDKLMNGEVDEATGAFKDNGQGITIGYDMFKKLKAKIGDKVILTIIPMTDTSDMAPMVIVGISDHKGTMTYNKELMLKVQGRDHDIDKASIMFSDETWIKPLSYSIPGKENINTFDLLHELLTHNEAHKAHGKKMLIDVKEMIDKADKQDQSSFKQMYVPAKKKIANGLRAEMQTYIHPLNAQTNTLPARKYMAQKIWEKYAPLAQKGFLPFDGVNPEVGIEQLVQAMTNIYEPQDMPVLSPLHYGYGNAARAFYSNKAIGSAAAASNYGLINRQKEAAQGNNPDDASLLKQIFQLSFGKEGAVDIFSNHPYKIDVQDYIAQMFLKDYNGDPKQAANFYKQAKANNISKTIGGTSEGVFNTTSKLSQLAISQEPTIQEAGIRGLAPLEGIKPLPLKNTLQVGASSIAETSIGAMQTPETKGIAKTVQTQADIAVNYALTLFRAMDTANLEADYGKVFEFVNANQQSTSNVHLPIIQRMISSDNTSAAMLYALDSNKKALYTETNPLPLQIKAVLKNQKTIDVASKGYKMSLYVNRNPDTGFGEKPMAIFEFPDTLTNIYPGYTQKAVQKNFPYAKVTSNAIHLPLDKIFNVEINGETKDVNPILMNKVGWLSLMSQEYVKQGEANNYMAETNKTHALNAVIEAMLVQNTGVKNMPVISSLNFNNDEKQAIFTDIIDHVIRKTALSTTYPLSEVAGQMLVGKISQKEIANHIVNQEKQKIYCTLHKIDSNLGISQLMANADTEAGNQALMQFIATQKTANNAVNKFENFVNSIKQTVFGYSKAGTLLLQKYLANGITPTVQGKPVLDILSEAAEVQLCKVKDKEYNEQLQKIASQKQIRPQFEEGSNGTQFSSQDLDMETTLAQLNDFTTLLPPSYTTKAFSPESFAKDWGRLLKPFRTTVDALSSWKLGMSANPLLSPQKQFDAALATFAEEQGLSALDIGKPEVLDSFLRSELKKKIGEEAYNKLSADALAPSVIVSANIAASIAALSPQLQKRNVFVVNNHIRNNQQKQAVQLGTLKDVYSLWADIQQASLKQQRLDKVRNISPFMAAMRRMNPGVRGTSRSIVDRYTSWYEPANSHDTFYKLTVPDGNGGTKVIDFQNYLLESDNIADINTSPYFKQYSPSVQYSEAADIERTKSYEMERAMEGRIKDFETQFKGISRDERFNAGKTLKMLASMITDAGISVQGSMQDGVPMVQLSTGEIEDPMHPLGQNLTIRGDMMSDDTQGVESAARAIVGAITATAEANNASKILAQQPYLYEMSKAFTAKLIWQLEQENNIKAMNEQLKSLQALLGSKGMEGVSREINNKREFLEKVLLLTKLSSSAGIDEQTGEEMLNPHYKWAVSYFPQHHQSEAALIHATRGTLIKQEEERNARIGDPSLQVDYEAIEKQVALLNAEGIAQELNQETGFRKKLDGFFSAMGADPSSQLMATASIASHVLPRTIQEQLLADNLDLLTPVNGDVLQQYSRQISKSYLSSVSVALEHLYRADQQNARHNLLARGITEEPENSFVNEEVLSSITEMRGDQYIWDRVHNGDKIHEMPSGTPVQMSYNVQMGPETKEMFTNGYIIGTNNGKVVMFDRNSFKIKLIDEKSISQIIEGRAIPSPFGIMKTGYENIQEAIEQSISSPYIKEEAAKAVQSYLRAKEYSLKGADTRASISDAALYADMAANEIKQAQEREYNIGNYIDEGASTASLKEAGAKALVAFSVYLGYLGFSKLAHASILGLAAGVSGIAGHNDMSTALGGLASTYLVTDYLINTLGMKTANNILSSYREALNTIGLKGVISEAFKVDDTKDKTSLKELQSLPSFTAEEIGLDKEYSKDKKKSAKQRVEALRFLEKFSANPDNIVKDFLEVKKRHAQGLLSHDDVEAIAEKVVPYLEQKFAKRRANPAYYQKLKQTLVDYGYEPQVKQWFDETGMTIEEAEDLLSKYRTEMLQYWTGSKIIPRSETKAKRIADIVSLNTLNAMGVGGTITETGKGRSINKLSQLATGQYGNRNVLERTQLGRFLSLYSRFRRTTNSYYWNDIMKNANVQSFVHDVAQHFPSQTFEYDSDAGAMEGQMGVKSNIRYIEGNLMMGNQDEIVSVEALKEYPYLQSFQKKLKWSSTLGAGMVMLKFGLPLLFAKLGDDEDRFATMLRNSPEIFDGSAILKELNQRVGVGDAYAYTSALITNVAVELLSNMITKDALQTNLENKTWTKKEAQTYVDDLLSHPSDIAMSLGMGKGLGSLSQLLIDGVYGNAMAVAMAKGVIGNGYGDSPDEQTVVTKSLKKREAMMVNNFLGSIYGVESLNSLILRPGIEIYGAYKNQEKSTKRDRTAKKKATEVMAERNPINLLYKEKN